VSKDDFMRRAIALSHERMEAGDGGPFGAVIVRDGAIVAEGWNQVTSENDPTAHAEIVAIRRACVALDNFVLDDCEIYTSCEPCPMCLSAIYWARLRRLYYGNSKDDAAGIGFDDAYLYREVGLAPGERSVPTVRLLADEALEAFRAWEAKPDKIAY
jgi:tRNA(Arg) A34 adenosine deaminase TadA